MKPKMNSSLDLHCFCQQSCLEIASWDVLQAADYSAYGGRSDVQAGTRSTMSIRRENHITK